jgi:hypothetical protein
MSTVKKSSTRKRKSGHKKAKKALSKYTPSGVRSGGWARAPLCGEIRCADTVVQSAGAPVNISVNGLFACLNGLFVGSALNQRVGRKITAKALDISLLFNVTGPNERGTHIRTVIVYDRQNNGENTPSFTSLYTGVYSATMSNPTDAVMAPRNLSNIARFSVLMDKRIELVGNMSGSSTFSASWPQEALVKHIGMVRETQYNEGNTGTSADIMSGALWLLIYSTNGTDPLYRVNVGGNIRLRYTT